MPKVAQVRFACQSCGRREAKWLGRCPDCGEWNSLVEEVAVAAPKSSRFVLASEDPPRSLKDVSAREMPRLRTEMEELDRVLGGGLVPGSLVLIGGDPGIGKSTLLMQALNRLVCASSEPRPVLYVSGEESAHQTALRAERLGARASEIWILAETRLEVILAHAERLRPAVLAIDSIQALASNALESIPGSISQVREVAARLLQFAKTSHVPTLIVGHVTKDGSIAGPKVLEHVVDTVLSFEGSSGHPYRILRASKNRFGSTQEIGVFEMRGSGLVEVENPSAAFLAERPLGAAGSIVAASVEGTRPLLVEVQALVAAPTGMPRRTALGVDSNRVSLLLAVLDRKAGMDVLGSDVFVNVAGGVEIEEPAVDLAILCAIASSMRGKPVDPATIVFGEVGLAGEVRAVSFADLRLGEAAKLGFKRAILPEATRARLPGRPALECVGVKNVQGALEAALGH